MLPYPAPVPAGGTLTRMVADPPWEPPLAGTEEQHLIGALDRLRTTFRWKVDGLDSTALGIGLGTSSLTLGGLLKHLARVEAQRFGPDLDDSPMGAPWDGVDWDADPDWDFTSAAQDSPAALYTLWDRSVEHSRAKLAAALAAGGLDQLVCIAWPDGRRASLRRNLCDLIEEYGRHTGHADLLREAVDGRVGEDPPPDWRARN